MAPFALTAQVKVPFKQRTSVYTPDKKIYNIKGDFQMIGNSNLTLSPYDENGNNSGNMAYVDIDNNPQTLNSSSATLTFSTENGANPACSKIIYAGLYWTGRANDEESPNTVAISENDYKHNESFAGYNLAISRQGTNNNYYPRYTFSIGTTTVYFDFTNNADNSANAVTVTVNGTTTNVPCSITTSFWYNDRTATLTTPYDLGNGLFITKFTRDKRAGRSAAQYQSYPCTATIQKKLDKRKVKLRFGSETYLNVTANVADIYYPISSDGYMYSAYAEVTDYVKAHGLGTYTVADIALRTGKGGSTGFYGGWGMVVIYENSKMKWRDVTVFDGHAYVQGSTTISYELPVEGFHTAQNGAVNMKLGIIAGEGDKDIDGDYFQIQKLNTNNYQSLSHGGNSADNFFNGSIFTGGNQRNPNKVNNFGMDVAMFNIDNSGNSIIANNQTSTKFKYGSTQDTYIISCIAMAVDAYIPQPEALNACISINGQPNQANMQVLPNGEIEYSLDIRNKGTEAISNSKIVIPIPYTATFVSCNSVSTIFPQPTYDGTLGPNGSLVWNLGTIPYDPSDPNKLLGKMTFSLRATTDCFLLSNPNCVPAISINGAISGVGATSGTTFSNYPFISGFRGSGECLGEPINDPINTTINITDYVSANCTGTDYTTRKFDLCKLPNTSTIPFSDITANFPAGSRFWSQIDATGQPTSTAIEYTNSNSFPNTVGTNTYYCIPPGFTNCYWAFTIEVKKCNFWLGSSNNSTSCSNWGLASNWTDNRVPNPGEDIVFATTTNNGQEALSCLTLDNDRVVGNITNESSMALVIPTSKTLTVNGTVKTNLPEKILIKSAVNEANGALIFKDLNNNTAIPATVEFASKSKPASGTWPRVWQYFGTSVSGKTLQQLFGSNAYGSIYGYNPGSSIIVRKYNESLNLSYSTQEKWEDVALNDLILPYNGYEITQPTYGSIHNFKGTLVTTPSYTVNLPISPVGINSRGNYILANPYAAPIFISNLKVEDFTNLEETIYLYNSGSRQDWIDNNNESGSNITSITPGTYFGVPIALVTTLGVHQIPSMQGFLLVSKDKSNPSAFKFRYETVYKPSSSTVPNEGMRVKAEKGSSVKNEAAHKKYPLITVNVKGNNSQDRLYMATASGATKGFDNGWDGYKYMTAKSAQVYVIDPANSRYQVSTDENLNDTYIGFRSGGEDSYELSIKLYDTENTYRKIFIQDLATNITKEVVDGMKMNFLTMEGSNEKRFKIIAVQKSSPADAREKEDEKLFIKVMNTSVLIENNTGREGVFTVYNLIGQPIMSQTIPLNTSTMNHSLEKGSYLFEAKNEVGKYTVKAIIQ